MILNILLIWFLLSLPLALIVGRRLREVSADYPDVQGDGT